MLINHLDIKLHIFTLITLSNIPGIDASNLEHDLKAHMGYYK